MSNCFQKDMRTRDVKTDVCRHRLCSKYDPVCKSCSLIPDLCLRFKKSIDEFAPEMLLKDIISRKRSFFTRTVPDQILAQGKAINPVYPDIKGQIFYVKIIQISPIWVSEKTKVYSSTSQMNEKVVMKWPRHSHKCLEADHLNVAIRTVNISVETVEAFVKHVNTSGWKIFVNYPSLLKCWGETCEKSVPKVLLEPYVRKRSWFQYENGQKAQSNKPWMEILRAFSHFSYAWSQGRFIISGLRGSVDKKDQVLIICNPIVLTVRGGRFGCRDTGSNGMDNFFSSHLCNSVCCHWTQPRQSKKDSKCKKYQKGRM